MLRWAGLLLSLVAVVAVEKPVAGLHQSGGAHGLGAWGFREAGA